MKFIFLGLLMTYSLSVFAAKSSVNCDLEKEGYDDFSYVILNGSKVFARFIQGEVTGYANIPGQSQTSIRDGFVFIEIGELKFQLPVDLFNSQPQTSFIGYVQDTNSNFKASCYLTK